MNQSVFDYCKGHDLEQTRSQAYKKNDQAWVEQKNGSVVRRLVGYGRLSGADARNALAQLYASSRLTSVRFILEGLAAQRVPDWVSKDSRVSTI